MDPKKPLLPKFQTQKNPSDPPVINICEWGPGVLIQYKKERLLKSEARRVFSPVFSP